MILILRILIAYLIGVLLYAVTEVILMMKTLKKAGLTTSLAWKCTYVGILGSPNSMFSMWYLSWLAIVISIFGITREADVKEMEEGDE